ncbi:M48 metallopeptidase family protein [Arthrobacter mobilis]|uniref:M48 metallopeptidase family protein n=1 Tax=Arthrobacter mobilis TaxID=2724944 RepID=UPI0028A724E4|nr:M48 family metallopeptidase [Arthrobacter mobilis]
MLGALPSTTRDGVPVVVKRSHRRRRTVSAAWRDGTAVISIPGHFTRTQEQLWVRRMLEKLQARPAGAGAPRSDEELLRRSLDLSRRFLGGQARPASIRWVSNQNGRWGSATPARGTIRISDKIGGMPAWVVDYVILHELAHLLEAGHGPRFWQLLAGYPQLERAKAFLEGAAYAMGRGLGDDPLDGDPDDGEPAEPGAGDPANRGPVPAR